MTTRRTQYFGTLLSIRRSQLKLAIFISAFIGGIVVCYLLTSMGPLQKLGGLPLNQSDPGQSISIYLSFVGVLLTAVTAVLTALAIGIGIIAAYTFAGLKTEATNVAKMIAKEISETTATRVSADALSEIKIKAIVESYLAIYIKEREGGIEWDEDSVKP